MCFLLKLMIPAEEEATQWEDTISTYGYPFHKVHVDKNEITNQKWNQVTQWALANGYSGLSWVPADEGDNLPRSGITFWQAIKCVMPGRKEGLKPAYYTDPTELKMMEMLMGMAKSPTAVMSLELTVQMIPILTGKMGSEKILTDEEMESTRLTNILITIIIINLM